MRRIALLALSLCACAESLPYTTELVGMKGGLRRYHVTCDHDVSSCWEGARKACKGDYVIEDKEGRFVGYGALRRYEGDMLVVCENPQ